MELTDKSNEALWVLKLLHYFPEAIPTDLVESLREANTGRIEIALPFLALFLELAGSENRVCDVALAFR